MKTFISILAVLLVLAIAFMVGKENPKDSFRKADSATVVKVDAALSEALAKDSELIQQWGPFVRLQGSGYQRLHYAWQLVERIEMSRTATFQRGTVWLNVTIWCAEAVDLDQFPIGGRHWKPMPREDGSPGLEIGVGIGQHLPPSGSEPVTPKAWPLSVVALSGDTSLVFLGRVNHVGIWDRNTGSKLSEVNGQFDRVNGIAYAEKAGLLAFDCQMDVKVMETATGRITASFPLTRSNSSGGPRENPKVGLSADGHLLVHAHYQRVGEPGQPATTEMGKVENLSSGSTRGIIRYSGSPPVKSQPLYTSPDGRHVLMALEGTDQLQCWETQKLMPEWTTTKASRDYSSRDYIHALFTPVTGMLVTYQYDFYTPASPKTWNIASGKKEKTFDLPPQDIWRDFHEALTWSLPERIPMTISADERLVAVALANGRAPVWHLPSGRLAGLIYNTDWSLVTSLANEKGREWHDPPAQPAGSTRITVGQPYRGEKLAAIGFDSANRLIGVSLDQDVAWVWKADMSRLPKTRPE